MVLGTPSIRVNSFINKISYLNELEIKFELGFGFFPNQESEILQKIQGLVEQPLLEESWQKKKEKMLKKKIDLNEWMIQFLESF